MISDDKLKKIIDLQRIFETLPLNIPPKPLVDGTYDVTITGFEIRRSAKGNDYVQITFNAPGFVPIIKRVMVSNTYNANKNINHILNFAKKFGYVVGDCVTAVNCLNRLKLKAKIEVTNSDKEFYDVTISLKEVEEIHDSI